MNHNHEWCTGRIALVTGASSGIGLETAVSLGQAGANVGIHYRTNRDGAESVLHRIRSVGDSGGKGILIQGDLAIRADIDRGFGELQAAFGPRLDMLVNNAGDWMDREPITECREAQWDHIFDVNVKSAFLCSQTAARIMIHQKNGAIVNLGSVAGHTGGGGGTVPYAAAKAAVHTFTRGLAKELAPHGVRVNCVSPGMVDTPMIAARVDEHTASVLKGMTPVGRYAEPEEIANAILYLLSPRAGYITGLVHDVNGGLLMR